MSNTSTPTRVSNLVTFTMELFKFFEAKRASRSSRLRQFTQGMSHTSILMTGSNFGNFYNGALKVFEVKRASCIGVRVLDNLLKECPIRQF